MPTRQRPLPPTPLGMLLKCDLVLATGWSLKGFSGGFTEVTLCFCMSYAVVSSCMCTLYYIGGRCAMRNIPVIFSLCSFVMVKVLFTVVCVYMFILCSFRHSNSWRIKEKCFLLNSFIPGVLLSVELVHTFACS